MSQRRVGIIFCFRKASIVMVFSRFNFLSLFHVSDFRLLVSCLPNTFSFSMFYEMHRCVTKVCGKGQMLEDLDGLDLIELIFYFLLGLNKSTK